MILDVFQCSQLFSDVFSWVVTFMDNHPLCGHYFSGCPQMFSDDHRCFWIFSRYSIDVLLTFSRCSLDILRMFEGFFGPGGI